MFNIYKLNTTLFPPLTGSAIKTIQFVASESTLAVVIATLALTHSLIHQPMHSPTHPCLHTHLKTCFRTHVHANTNSNHTQKHTHSDDGIQSDSVHVLQHMCDALRGCTHGIQWLRRVRWVVVWGDEGCLCVRVFMSTCVRIRVACACVYVCLCESNL